MTMGRRRTPPAVLLDAGSRMMDLLSERLIALVIAFGILVLAGAAAEAVFHAHEAAALPTLDAALAKETDPQIKRALTEARAAVMLNLPGSSEADQLQAVSVLRARADQDALALLSGLSAGASPNL